MRQLFLLLCLLCSAGMLFAQPANDLCTAATPLTIGGAAVSGTTVAATQSPEGTCITGVDVFYSFTGNGNILTVTGTPVGTTFDMEIGLFSGSCAAPMNDQCRDATFGGDPEVLTLNSVAGASYFVYIGHWSDTQGVTGDFSVQVADTGNPSPTVSENDLCADAINLVPGLNALGNTTVATNIGALDCDGTEIDGGGVWFTFIGAGSEITLSTANAGTNFDTELNLYSGTCDALVCEDSDDDGGTGTTSVITFTAVENVTYYVYVDGSSTSRGNFELSLAGIVNDDDDDDDDDDDEDDDDVDPVFEVQLAAQGQINVTLNDDCQAMLDVRQVLVGNYDVDGDGEEPESDQFRITVQDEDPTNGPIIDGCGQYTYMVSTDPILPDTTNGFVGAFDPFGPNWNFFLATVPGAPFDPTSQDFNIFADDETLTIQTLGDDFTPGGNNLFQVFGELQITQAGTLTFDYDFNGVDAPFDLIFALRDFEGDMMSEDIFPTTSAATTSSVSIEVNVGDLLTIGVQDDGFAPFGGVLFSTLNLTNLQFIVPGFESDVTGFINSWGLVRAEDKTPPTVVAPVAPTNLFCDQINGITLTELNFNTSRCYRTNSAGQFINGQDQVVSVAFLPLEFRNRIIAGGGFPTITDGCSNVEVCVNDVITFADGPNADEQCNPVTLTRTFTARDAGPCTLGNGEVSQPTVVSYDIIFAVPTLADVTGNMLAREISCSDPMNLLPANQFGDANPAPRPQDFPFITTSNGPVPITGSFCNLAVTVQDGPRTVTCPQTYKFFRTFTVLNWCTPNAAPLIFTRLVKVGDFDAPVITAPTQDLNFDGIADAGLFFSTNALGCLSFFTVPSVVVTDNCSAVTAITVLANIFPNQDLTATPIGSFLPGQTTSGIPQGTHTLRYTAVDPCGNSSFVDVTIVIDDATAPVAKCEDGLNISIGGSPDNMGVAIISAEDIDKNSYDECSGVTLAIACIDTTDNSLLDPILGYQPTITVDCDDLGRKGISLRVTDAAGNVNFCWLTVLIEDKATPICIPPTPRQILCSDLPFDFPANVGLAFGLDQVNVGALLNDLFGTPFAQDNCPNSVTQTLTPVDTRDNCGIGTIVRSFRVTDAQGLSSIGSCSQTIVVLEQHDYTIKFPGDSDSEDCDLDMISQIMFTERACDLIAVSVHPDTFAATATECYKIRNTIEVINWCEYDGIEEPITLPRDADGDGNLVEDFWLHVVSSTNLNSINDDRAFLDRDGNRLNGLPSYINDLAGFPITGVVDPTPPTFNNADATGNGYGTDARRGYFRYIQFVKVYDGVAPTIDTTGNQTEFCSFDGALCAGDLELNFTVDDACSPDAISIVSVTVDPFVVDANGDGIITAVEFQPGTLPATASVSVGFNNNNMVITGTNIPIGRHAIRVEILDGCGNRAAVIYVVEIIDCKAPTPICINGLTATLMPDGNGGGMAAIWASDFVASPSTDCTPDVFFTLYRSADASVNNFAPMMGDTGLILTCPDLGLLPVRVYTQDGAGNFDFCETTLLVQENQASITCGAGVGSIAGLIATEGGANVTGAEVAVSGSSNETMVTTNGTYSFSLPMGGDYTVTPQLDANHLNGVSTFDLVLISKHILG
ncbi:MAG: PPC domain-containing protein, partial [Saprospiraceae bacterium]